MGRVLSVRRRRAPRCSKEKKKVLRAVWVLRGDRTVVSTGESGECVIESLSTGRLVWFSLVTLYRIEFLNGRIYF